MNWTEQSPSETSYYDMRPSNETEWDNGDTLWDVSGNVEGTNWDLTPQIYTDQSSTSVTWTEA